MEQPGHRAPGQQDSRAIDCGPGPHRRVQACGGAFDQADCSPREERLAATTPGSGFPRSAQRLADQAMNSSSSTFVEVDADEGRPSGLSRRPRRCTRRAGVAARPKSSGRDWMAEDLDELARLADGSSPLGPASRRAWSISQGRRPARGACWKASGRPPGMWASQVVERLPLFATSTAVVSAFHGDG